MIKIANVFPQTSHSRGEICALFVQGMSTKAAARALGISHRTAEDHRLNIYRKTNLQGMQAVIYKALGEPAVTA